MTVDIREQEVEEMYQAWVEQKKYQQLYMTVAQLIEPPRPFSQPFVSYEALYKATRVDRGVGDYYDVWVIAHWSQYIFPDLETQKQELYRLLWHGPYVAALRDTAVNEQVIGTYVFQAQLLARLRLRPGAVADRLMEFRPWLKRAVLANSRVQGEWLTRRALMGQWGES